jgi:hypothetical protein
MYCKDCKFREKDYYCVHPKIGEELINPFFPEKEKEQDFLSYSYSEGGRFLVSDYFGCVHFKAKSFEHLSSDAVLAEVRAVLEELINDEYVYPKKEMIKLLQKISEHFS